MIIIPIKPKPPIIDLKISVFFVLEHLIIFLLARITSNSIIFSPKFPNLKVSFPCTSLPMQPPIETLSPPGILYNASLYFLILSRISLF